MAKRNSPSAPKAVVPPARRLAPATQLENLLNLDRLIHERIRLGIVSALAINQWLSFNDLRRLLKTTDGNLSVHAAKLEDAGYIACRKFFDGRIPRTEYRLTPTGRRAFEKYIEHMEDLIHRTRRD